MVDHETGEVLAHVGGRDYAQVPYDFIESGKRPLGTAFFPFIYAAGFEARTLTPATIVEDEPMDNRSVMVGGREGILGEWGMEVAVAGLSEKRSRPARRSKTSKIGATVRFADQTGLQRVVDTAMRLRPAVAKSRIAAPRLAVGFEEVSMKQAVRAMSVFPSAGSLGPEKLIYVDRVENPTGPRGLSPRTQACAAHRSHRSTPPHGRSTA